MMAKTRKREAKQHTTREAKFIATPGTPAALTTRTRETDPHLYHQPRKYGPAQKEWPRRNPYYHPCKFCGRIKTDTNSQAVYSRRTEETQAYLVCRHCYKMWTCPRERRPL